MYKKVIDNSRAG